MRIVIPLRGGSVSEALTDAELLRLYEDDHGRLLGARDVCAAGDLLDAAIDSGADALVCGAVDESERAALTALGLPVFVGYSGEADAAARAFLARVVTHDPTNTCNACGWK